MFHHSLSYILNTSIKFIADLIKCPIKQQSLAQSVFFSGFCGLHRLFIQSEITGKNLPFLYSKVRVDKQGEPVHLLTPFSNIGSTNERREEKEKERYFHF